MHFAHAQSVSAPDDFYGNPDRFHDVSGLSITTSLTDVRVTVSVSSGDVKITTTGGLTAPQGYEAADWTSGASSISFFGLLSSVSSAPSSLQYQGTSGTMTTSVSPTGAAYYEATNNYYEYVNSGDIDWNIADASAAAMSLNGAGGYLATITSQGEMNFIVEKIGGENPVWLGGSDAASEGDWMWTRGVDGTGAASAVQFWDGDENGNVVNGLFEDWCDGEPNDNGSGGEHYLQITFDTNDGNVAGGCWNDLRNNGSTSDDYNPTGYVVEYNGTAGSTETTTILTTTRPTVTSITRATPSVRSISADDLSGCYQPQLTVTFSKTVKNVTADDFTVSGAGSTGVSIDSISGSDGDSTYTVTFDCIPSANRGAFQLSASPAARTSAT